MKTKQPSRRCIMEQMNYGSKDSFQTAGNLPLGRAILILFNWVKVTKPLNWSLKSVIITNISGLYNYGLKDYLDTREGVPANGMVYQNTNLQNCSVALISLTQGDSGPCEDQVNTEFKIYSFKPCI